MQRSVDISRDVEREMLTMAKAMPMKAPTLRTTGIHSTLELGAVEPLRSCGLEGCTLSGDDHFESNQGCNVPNATAEAPQKRI